MIGVQRDITAKCSVWSKKLDFGLEKSVALKTFLRQLMTFKDGL